MKRVIMDDDRITIGDLADNAKGTYHVIFTDLVDMKVIAAICGPKFFNFVQYICRTCNEE